MLLLTDVQNEKISAALRCKNLSDLDAPEKLMIHVREKAAPEFSPEYEYREAVPKRRYREERKSCGNRVRIRKDSGSRMDPLAFFLKKARGT